MPHSRSVLLLGATGLVGGECLRLLQKNDNFSRIVVLTRGELDYSLLGPKVEHHIVDFEHLTAAARYFAVDQIICALGTTMKAARTKKNFRTVDLLYPITAAHLGLEKKASHFLVVSSLGADPRSPIFYNRIKGELEKALTALPLRALTIARPSVLTGKRDKQRTGERLAATFSFLTPAKIRPIPAADVALGLVHQAVLDQPGKKILESADLRRIADDVRSPRPMAQLKLDATAEVSHPSVA
jgi:uncharacterized protein YbjT (DUF2867 family)